MLDDSRDGAGRDVSERTVAPARAPQARCRAEDIYIFLTGEMPANASAKTDHAFDRHVLAAILAMGFADALDGDVAASIGLSERTLATLMSCWFPHAQPLLRSVTSTKVVADDEWDDLHRLLLANRTADTRSGRWLAAMVARRALEPNHLWEDLGLRDRAELTRLLMRHFQPLASRNERNMRWKRFFYRVLCEDDGLVMCRAPSCHACGDFESCFGAESGESRLARARLESERAIA